MNKRVIDYDLPIFEGTYLESNVEYSVKAYPDEASDHHVTNRYVIADTPKGEVRLLITLTDGEWIDYYFNSHANQQGLFKVLNEKVSKEVLQPGWKEITEERNKKGGCSISFFEPEEGLTEESR
jgi:hypothetical protein